MAGNTNDWRLQEPDLRKRVFHIIYGKLKTWFPQYGHNEISQMAGKMEDKIYGIAKDKDDYARKIQEELNLTEQKCKIMQTISAVNATKSLINATNTQDSGAQLVLNPGQSVPTQTPISQQNINLSAASQRQQLLPPQKTISGSQSGQSVPTQTPTSQQWLPQQLLPPLQHMTNEQIRIGNLGPPHMQQQAQPQPQQHLQSHSVPTQTPTSQQNINLSTASQRQQLLPPQQTISGSQSGAQVVLFPGQSVPTLTPSSQQNINLSAASQRQQLLPPQQTMPGSQSGQSVPTQTPTSQQWLPQQLLPPLQHMINEQIRIGNLGLPHMQQQAQPQPQQHLQSLLKQPIHQSFPQSSIFSNLPSSGNQNSQLLPRYQYPIPYLL